ncbi:hypothetical protein Tco_0589306 [Tanacetum coccineum]
MSDNIPPYEIQLEIIKRFLLDISISELNESLVVAEYTSEVNGRVYGVWMMGEEGGAMTSFKKIFTINTPGSVVDKVLGYKKSGEPIVEIKKRNQDFTKIIVYDPCSEHINDFGITGEQNDGSSARCGARNDRVLEAYKGYVELGMTEFWKLTKDLWS